MITAGRIKDIKVSKGTGWHGEPTFQLHYVYDCENCGSEFSTRSQISRTITRVWCPDCVAKAKEEKKKEKEKGIASKILKRFYRQSLKSFKQCEHISVLGYEELQKAFKAELEVFLGEAKEE